MKRLFTFLIICGAACMAARSADRPEAYRLVDSQGVETSYDSLLAAAAEADVVCFGEMHNCALTHWLERRFLADLHSRVGNRLRVGFEMLEADGQLIIDEYLQGLIASDRFQAEERLWPNHETDYAPLVDYAVENGLPVVATNVPRRYANIVSRRGLEALDSLSDAAKALLPPLPIPYTPNPQMAEGMAMMSLMGRRDSNPAFMAQAQALKDATMACFIARAIGASQTHPVMLHFNGNYHTDFHDGIIHYLGVYAPKARTVTIATVKQEDINTLEEAYKGRADYIFIIPEDMATSY